MCLDFLSYFSTYLSLSFPYKMGYSVTSPFILQPKGLTFPGSQHPPFFQLVLRVLRRSKLLLTPVTAIVSFCFASTSCFLLLCVCFFNTNHCLAQWRISLSSGWKKKMYLGTSLILWFTNFEKLFVAHQLRKHKVDGVRRMTAHPLLPLCKFRLNIIDYGCWFVIF
jgi:hypothetical protein